MIKNLIMIRKSITLFMIIVFRMVSLKGQIPCYDPPSLDFSGTPVLFSYLLEDTVITDRCQGVTFDRHRGEVFTKPFEYDDTYVISAKSITGSILLGVDQHSHDTKWSRFDNHLVNRQQRSISIGAYRKRSGDSLEMLTYHSQYVFDGNSINAIIGYPGRRIINYKTGEILYDYWIGDSLKIEGVDFSKVIYLIYLGNDVFPRNITNSSLYHLALPRLLASDTSSFRIDHRYVDTTTLIPYWQKAPLFQLQGIAAPDIYLDCSENGVHPNNLLTFGPFYLNGERKMYFYRYLLGTYYRTRKIVLDKWGYLLENEDITQKMGENNTNGLWLVDDVIETTNKQYVLRGSVKNIPEFWEYGHASYILIDSSGNLMSSRKKLAFDGLRPFLHNVCEIPKRNSLLHVFRPQENNDLYFYEEFADGTYRKAGQLVNPNQSFYAFEPHQVGLMENGDVFVYLTGLIDSLSSGQNSNFNSGGWKGIIRVDGNSLGITTSTNDQVSTSKNCKIYPNPALTHISIDAGEGSYPKTGRIYNSLGQWVHTCTLHERNAQTDISSLAPGLYFIRVTDVDNHQISAIGKWVKE